MLISSPWQQKIRKRRLTQNLPSYHQPLPVKARFGFTQCWLQSYSIKQISCGFVCGNRQGALICRGWMWTPFCVISFSVCTCQAELQPEIHVSGAHESRLLRQVQPERGMARQLLWVRHPFPLSCPPHPTPFRNVMNGFARVPSQHVEKKKIGSSFLNARMCCFSPSLRMLNDERLAFGPLVGKEILRPHFGLWGKCHEHVFPICVTFPKRWSDGKQQAD